MKKWYKSLEAPTLAQKFQFQLAREDEIERRNHFRLNNSPNMSSREAILCLSDDNELFCSQQNEIANEGIQGVLEEQATTSQIAIDTGDWLVSCNTRRARQRKNHATLTIDDERKAIRIGVRASVAKMGRKSQRQTDGGSGEQTGQGKI